MLPALPASGTLWTEEWVDSSPDAGFYCDLEVASDGTVHVAYRDDGDEDMEYALRSPAGVWTRETVDASDDAGSFATLALASDGTPHVSYFRNFSCVRQVLQIARGLPGEMIPNPCNTATPQHRNTLLGATGASDYGPRFRLAEFIADC